MISELLGGTVQGSQPCRWANGESLVLYWPVCYSHLWSFCAGVYCWIPQAVVTESLVPAFGTLVITSCYLHFLDLIFSRLLEQTAVKPSDPGWHLLWGPWHIPTKNPSFFLGPTWATEKPLDHFHTVHRLLLVEVYPKWGGIWSLDTKQRTWQKSPLLLAFW